MNLDFLFVFCFPVFGLCVVGGLKLPLHAFRQALFHGLIGITQHYPVLYDLKQSLTKLSAVAYTSDLPAPASQGFRITRPYQQTQ